MSELEKLIEKLDRIEVNFNDMRVDVAKLVVDVHHHIIGVKDNRAEIKLIKDQQVRTQQIIRDEVRKTFSWSLATAGGLVALAYTVFRFMG